MTEQTTACINALSAVLAAAGSSLDRIVKTTVFLADMGDFKEVNEEYARLITHRPARSCIAVKTLPMNARVSIGCFLLLRMWFGAAQSLGCFRCWLG